jgi:RNA polymerase sigma factor (sigma-70 family)
MADTCRVRDTKTPGWSSGVPAAEPSDRQLLERFTRRQDEAAFAALVQRHGPLVLGVCRRILQHAQDAEDAFQATFLVLVRRADAIAKPDSLANWLYGVAYRTAHKARTSAARRRTYERQAVPMGVADPLPEALWRELRAVLDEELYHLPDKYREPLVLCYLQGKTNEEAARALGWPVGSMSARLARGREMLRDRLTSRHRDLAPAFVAVVLTRPLELVRVPAQLSDLTVRAAVSLATAKGTSLVAPALRTLGEGTGKALGTSKRQLLIILLLALVGITFGAGALAYWITPSSPPAAQGAGGMPTTPPGGVLGGCGAH